MWDFIMHCIWGSYLVEWSFVGEFLGVSVRVAVLELRSCKEAKRALGEVGAQNEG